MAKKVEIKNPFLVEGYAGSEYFCDRKEETQTLLSALENGRNITLISPRRMGKSGLIKHAFNCLQQSGAGIHCYYTDILHTSSLREMVQNLATAIFGSLDTPAEKLFNQITQVLRRCRPTLTPDPITGIPTLSFEIQSGEEEHSLAELFNYLERSGKRCYVAIDEFQQITEYEEKGVEALLRSHIQFLTNVSFIFSGSKKHIMQEMFTSPKRPFYQSTQTLSLQCIDEEAYYEFASKHFMKSGKQLSKSVFHMIYDIVFGHTWYVQYWLNKLYELSEGEITEQDVYYALSRILAEEDDNMYAYSRALTKQQLRVMTAIAREGKTTTPYASSFIKSHNLPATSTVRSCIAVLIEKEYLLENRSEYSVYNRFFMLWLRNN